MPLPHLLGALRPRPADIDLARIGGHARHAVLVFILQQQANPFAERCLYIAESTSPLIRLTNFTVQYGNAARNPGRTMLCAEYWLDPDDTRWQTTDSDLVREALDALAGLPFRCDGPTLAHRVMRFPFVSPVRTPALDAALHEVRLAMAPLSNLYLLGRAGSFLYADQDVVIEQGLRLAAQIAQSYCGRVKRGVK